MWCYYESIFTQCQQRNILDHSENQTYDVRNASQIKFHIGLLHLICVPPPIEDSGNPQGAGNFEAGNPQGASDFEAGNLQVPAIFRLEIRRCP